MIRKGDILKCITDEICNGALYKGRYYKAETDGVGDVVVVRNDFGHLEGYNADKFKPFKTETNNMSKELIGRIGGYDIIAVSGKEDHTDLPGVDDEYFEGLFKAIDNQTPQQIISDFDRIRLGLTSDIFCKRNGSFEDCLADADILINLIMDNPFIRTK